MFSNPETQMLVGSLIMLGVGIAFLVAAILIRRGNTTAKKWSGSSSKLYAPIGIFATVSGLLNLGRFVVPDRFAGEYATFFLASTILLVGNLIITGWRDRRAQ